MSLIDTYDYDNDFRRLPVERRAKERANNAGNFANLKSILDNAEGLRIRVFHETVTLVTDGHTTNIGLDPDATVLHAAIRVSTEIAGLASADNSITLNDGTIDYCTAAQGATATTIAVNKKGHYVFDPTDGPSSAALALTVDDNSGDRTPSAGAVEVYVVYIENNDLPDA